MSERTAKAFLRGIGWLSNQPEWLKDALLSRARLRTYEAGEYTHHADDEPGGIFGIVDGGFGVVVPSGAEMIVCHVIWAGAWFGLGPILATGRRTMSFRATETSRALVVSFSDLQSIGTQTPELYRRLGALSEHSMQTIAARIVGDLLITSGERRTAAVLVRLAGGGAAPTPFPLRLSQSMIGQMSNSSRDRVNRALQKFATSGWVELRYNAVVILDAAALDSYARGET